MTLREIDALVLKHVFNYEFPSDRCGRCGWPLYETLEEGCTREVCCYVGELKCRADEATAYYTTDPAASKQVREKLAETWPSSCLSKSAAEVNTQRPFDFCLHPAAFTERSVYGPYCATEELAVALCALKSCGVDVDAPAVSAGGE